MQLTLRVIGALLVVAGAAFFITDGVSLAPAVMILGGAAAFLSSYTTTPRGRDAPRGSS